MDEMERMRGVMAAQMSINDADPGLDEVMNAVVAQAQTLTGASGAVVELAEGDEMVYAAVSGSAAGQEGLRLSLHHSLSGLCVRLGQVLECNDSDVDDRVDADACRKVGARSMVVAPLVHHGATVGVLKVLPPLPNTFDAGDVTTLQMLADFVASAINRASIFDDAARLASTDGLTGLANRRAMIEYLAEGLEQIARREDNLAVLFIDLDGFKPINDTYGHGTGDEVLIIISKRLHGCCRDTDFVARVGGDEFCVIAPGCRTRPWTPWWNASAVPSRRRCGCAPRQNACVSARASDRHRTRHRRPAFPRGPRRRCDVCGQTDAPRRSHERRAGTFAPGGRGA